MPPRHAAPPLEDVIDALDRTELAAVLRSAADRYPDVERLVRLAAARADGDLATVRDAVDRGLRTRRFLDYHDSNAWAASGRPIVDELGQLADSSPSRELVELLQRAVGHVVKVMMHADDSSGLIGDLARDLLDAHARSCDAGVADPRKLATWMIRFSFTDQDFFYTDPVRYADALGESGLAAYRTAVDEAGPSAGYAARYARERLAVLDRDVNAIVALLGGELRHAGQFLQVAEAMAEIDRPDLVLDWAARGVAQGGGYPTDKLYEIACRTHQNLGQPTEALRLRRAHHERSPTSSTYAALKNTAVELNAWTTERDAARAVLRDHDAHGYVAALLADDEPDQAWQAALQAPAEAIGEQLWLTLADQRQPSHPADALAVYLRVADEILVVTDRRAYSRAVRMLKKARTAADAADQAARFSAHITRLRDAHRRRPTLIAMLDKAALAS